MRTLPQSYRKRIQAIILAVLVGAAAAFALPAGRTLAAADPLCYYKLGGNLPYNCVQDDTNNFAKEVRVDGHVNVSKPFKAGQCYTLADADIGWVTSQCSDPVFDQALRGATPIGVNNDATASKCTAGKCDLIAKVVNPILKFLAAAVGIVVTISIVIGGIQYSTSADDPHKIAAAKKRIFTALLAFGGFLLIWAFLQWLIPGGV